MAKKNGNSKKINELEAKIAVAEAKNTQALANLASEAAGLEAVYASNAVSTQAAKTAKVAKVIQTAEQKMTKGHRVAVDFGGGMIGQVSTELLNLGVRAIARWSPDSWFGQNSDILQGAPHFVLGLGIYIAEMASRKNMVLPTTNREVISEAAKLFSQLGFTNVVRALRIRYNEGKQGALDMAALQAEKADLQAKLAALQGQAK